MASSDPLGVDLAVTMDLDPSFRLCSGLKNYQNAIMRRLSSPRGCMESIGGDPNYGEDVRSHLNGEDRDGGELGRISAACVAQINQDPRTMVSKVQTVSAPALVESLVLNVSGETTDGPFDFVASVDEMTMDRINQGLSEGLPATQNDIVGQTVTVVNQAGSTGERGEPGATGAAGMGTGIEPNLDGLFGTDSGNEDLLKEVLCNFSASSASTLVVRFSIDGMVDGAATGTWRIRMGGTEGAADGTTLATINNVTSTAWATYQVSASVSNPGGVQRVKLTGRTSQLGIATQVQSTLVQFSEG